MRNTRFENLSATMIRLTVLILPLYLGACDTTRVVAPVASAAGGYAAAASSVTAPGGEGGARVAVLNLSVQAPMTAPPNDLDPAKRAQCEMFVQQTARLIVRLTRELNAIVGAQTQRFIKSRREIEAFGSIFLNEIQAVILVLRDDVDVLGSIASEVAGCMPAESSREGWKVTLGSTGQELEAEPILRRYNELVQSVRYSIREFVHQLSSANTAVPPYLASHFASRSFDDVALRLSNEAGLAPRPFPDPIPTAGPRRPRPQPSPDGPPRFAGTE